MSETNQTETQTVYIPMSRKQLIQVAAFGVAAGLIVWGLTYVLETYVLKSLLCSAKQVSTCAVAAQYGEVIATLIAGAIGLFILVKIQVFRPLLVVIATVVSLWGLIGVVSEQPWYIVGLSLAGMYLVGYLVFTWVTRLRLFWLVVILLLVLIVAMRLILTA
ncbi:MAG: rane protein of unknown function [Candidatus Saccharibacteria bacterium]|nr:rane protein of unknown function [Candidatus Saccharibacteria bacterium]